MGGFAKTITPGVWGFVCIIYFAYCNQSQPVRAVQVASLHPFGFLIYLWGEGGYSTSYFYSSLEALLTTCSCVQIWL